MNSKVVYTTREEVVSATTSCSLSHDVYGVGSMVVVADRDK